MLRRYAPLKPSRGTVIPEDVRRRVEERDRACAGWVVGMPGPCAGQPELDHVRASGGISMKSRSTADNLVRMCGAHHRLKTADGRIWRPILIDYIEGRDDPHARHVDPCPSCPPRVGA
jgi:hypothetical protein